MDIKNAEEKVENAMGYYKNIRECLIGLYEILNINFNENDIYHQAGMDNLITLHSNILEILNTSFTPRDIRIRLRKLEFDEKEAEEVFPL